MERGAINGIPCWLKVVEYTGGERIVLKEAPGVDGAVVESQGQVPDRFRLEFELIRDGEWIIEDAEAASLSLRSMFLAGGPFLVWMPTFGEVADLWLSAPYSLRFFDESRLAISSGSLELVQASPFIVLGDSAAATVSAAVGDLSKLAIEDFGNRVPAGGLSPAALARLNASVSWGVNVQGLIGAAFGPVNSLSASLQILRGRIQTLLRAPQNFASRLLSTFAGLLSLIPGLSKDGDQDTGSAAIGDFGTDKPSNVLVGSLLEGQAFDDDLGATQADLLGPLASEEDLAEQDEVLAAKCLHLVGVTSSVCLAATETSFATVQSVLTLAETLGSVFEGLLDLETIDHQVFAQSRFLWKATLAHLAEVAAQLPRLNTYTVQRDTDVFDILPDLYDSLRSEEDVQLAVDTLCALNSIADPTAISRGTELRYLDPLVL